MSRSKRSERAKRGESAKSLRFTAKLELSEKVHESSNDLCLASGFWIVSYQGLSISESLRYRSTAQKSM